MFSCPTCSKSFTRQNNLRRHLTTHDADRRHTCPTCAQSFHRLTNLQRHERSAHGPAKHICETCGERFSRVRQLRRHQQIHREYTCSTCAQSFHCTEDLQRHQRSVHPRHVCETCGDRFSRVRQLRRHQQIHREHTCPTCAESFRRVVDLHHHEKSVHGPVNQPCGLCGKLLVYAYQLRQHRREYICPTCGKSCRCLGRLQLHERSVHPKHACKICGERFMFPHQLRRHQKSHATPMETSATTQPPNPSPVDNHPPVQIAPPLTNPSPPVDSHPSVLPEVQFIDDSVEVPSDICPETDPVSEAYRRHWSMIRHCFQRGRPVLDVYNFRLTDIAQLSNYVNAIFTDQSHAFKLNLGFGYLLRHKETDQLRYYYPSANVHVFDQPFTVDNRDSLKMVLAQVKQLDPLEWARLQRPNTKWTVERVTNVTFFVTKLLYHVIS